MNQNRNFIYFIIASMAVMLGWMYVVQKIWPPPPQLTAAEKLVAIDGAKLFLSATPSIGGLGDAVRLAQPPRDVVRKALAEAPPKPEPKPEPKAEPRTPLKPPAKSTYVSLGDSSYFLQARFTSQGGGIDRVILTHFPQADQYGLKVPNPSDTAGGSVMPLHLIPSAEDLDPATRQALTYEELRPSFLMYLYDSPNDNRPDAELGDAAWTLVSKNDDPTAEVQEAVFAIDVPAKGIRITRTYTLEKKQYHVGLKVRVERLAGVKDPQPIRYSLSNGHMLPIEGTWYTSTYRNALIGWTDKAGRAKRQIEDSATIHRGAGGERLIRASDRTLQWVATTTQYFASVLAVDNQQDHRGFVEFARATAEGPIDPAHPQMGDITARMISEVMTPETAAVEHKYLLYHGPLKVRLLHQMAGERAVDYDLVERYEQTLNLRTLADYQSPGWLGSFASSIYWTDLTIASTNLMHALLGLLRRILPVPGLAIIALTVIVRGLLFPLSRRQSKNAVKMQEKMEKLKPMFKELEQQHKGDYQALQQAKTKLMLQHGVNPAAQLGGCLLMFAQMPIFMGLYYSLQENVFFRLQPFLWMPSLAAPDMLVWWTEKIPYISTPTSLGSMFYLGPYFNLLPVIAVALMIVQQKLFTPPPTDEQQEMQQSMMKYMMVFMGLMFYKIPAGLSLYFIASSLWGIIERKTIGKKPASGTPGDDPGALASRTSRDDDPKPNGGLFGRVAERWKELQAHAEGKRQFERKDPPHDRRKKKKKK